ncbi:MAG: 3-methyl-2-oxobutanoate hydroxymethyltransferase [Afipia sp.]|nr:3-methyl-2-oxobutanoate hydroxymethyltransferase [Afipia sp.]
MSTAAEKRRKVTIDQLRTMKQAKRPIVALGVYESVTASIADNYSVQIFMTGPSGPMSLFGYSNPAAISMEEQLCTLRAVSRVTKFALINAHMPFLSFQTSARDAVLNAGRLVAEGGADTVKCDATPALSDNMRAIVDAGIPVIAHLGVQALRRVEQSGYGLKCTTAEQAKRLIDDAHHIARSGIFALLLEHVCADVVELLAQQLEIPVLSLGSGGRGDGVCIVAGDLLNYSAFKRPAHAGQMADLMSEIDKSLSSYAAEVRNSTYPAAETAPTMAEDEYKTFLKSR